MSEVQRARLLQPSRPEPQRIIRRSGALSVYAATGPAGEPIVVKHFDGDAAQHDPIGRLRFAREMHLASVLTHPSIPSVVARGEGWIGFEKLHSSLSDPETARRWSSPDRARSLLCALAGALAYVHAFGIVHGDIKPAHVMFRDEQPVLIDLGIASIGGEDLEFADEFAGTPAWMAPEQLLSARRHPSADIWSLCAVVTFLLTGTRPYDGAADDVLARRRAGEQPQFPLTDDLRHADADLCRVLEEGLGSPEERPTAAAIVQHLGVKR